MLMGRILTLLPIILVRPVFILIRSTWTHPFRQMAGPMRKGLAWYPVMTMLAPGALSSVSGA